MATPTAFKNCAQCRQDNNQIVVALIGSDNYVYVGLGPVANVTTAAAWSALVNTQVGASAIGCDKGQDGLVRISVISNTNAKLGFMTQSSLNLNSWTNTNLAGTPTGVAGAQETVQLDNGLVMFGLISNTGGNTSQGNFAVQVMTGVNATALGAATVIYGT
jgi:hypothetical protein